MGRIAGYFRLRCIPESGRLFEELGDLLQLRDRLLGVAAVLANKTSYHQARRFLRTVAVAIAPIESMDDSWPFFTRT